MLDGYGIHTLIWDAARTLLSSGRACVNCHYTSISAMPWYDQRASLTSCVSSRTSLL